MQNNVLIIIISLFGSDSVFIKKGKQIAVPKRDGAKLLAFFVYLQQSYLKITIIITGIWRSLITA